MTREEKIKAIYEEIANKELTFGCKAKHTTKRWLIYDVILVWQMIYWEKYFVRSDSLWYDVEWVYEKDWTFETIWHPVMIGDVIKRIKENIEISYWEYLVKLLGQLSRLWLWRELGLSIDDQTDECIDYVYSLIKKS